MSPSIQQHVPLGELSTLKVGGEASYYTQVSKAQELASAVVWAKKENLSVQILGGGSNVLVSDEGIEGLVIHMMNKGMTFTQNGDTVLVTAQAGEDLDAVVAYSVAHGWWGLENLSHIPGTVGAAPIQNVGAYGVETKDVLHSLVALDMQTGELRTFAVNECDFAYRNSFFKTPQGKEYVVLEVTFALSQKPAPKMAYRDLVERFKESEPSLQEIRDAVIAIRAGKFPNWHEVGTAGSFFKNPIVTQEKFAQLHTAYPELPGFRTDEGGIKLSLGYILDKILSLRGHSKGNVSLYEKQALVLVAAKGATASEIESFAHEVEEKVQKELEITIEWEVTRMP